MILADKLFSILGACLRILEDSFSGHALGQQTLLPGMTSV